MGEQRFFLKNIDPSARQIIFPADISHQIKHVLRCQEGDRVIVLDGEGRAYQVEIGDLNSEQVTAKVLNVGEAEARIPIHIALFFPLSRREKVEWILQKGTEVGVSAFHPFISERSLVQDTALDNKKTSRWEAIIREAAEQSGRAILPELIQPQKLNALLTGSFTKKNYDVALVASVAEKETSLAEKLDALRSGTVHTIALFVGAEGGFSDSELAAFQGSGIQPVSLGMHILRMETAAIVFPALVNYHLNTVSA